jgi:Mrp family chromosome partitioning ATPase
MAKIERENMKHSKNESNQIKDFAEESPHQIGKKIIVLSGKGGVGKSTVSVNLALALSLKGFKVGLLDIDLHGPSIPTMLGIVSQRITSKDKRLEPIRIGNMKVMSIGLLLERSDSAIIWRGPLKGKMIEQFVRDTNWGELDYLIADCPPGTGDELITITRAMDNTNGAVIVSTPQIVSSVDVSKSITFCTQLNIPIIGLIENMSSFRCPNCNTELNIFAQGGGKKIADQYKIELLGSIPIDPDIVKSCDSGKPYVHFYPESSATKEFAHVTTRFLEQIKRSEL